MFRISKQKETYYLFLLRKVISGQVQSYDNFQYWKCSKICKFLVVMKFDKVDAEATCWLCGRNLKDNAGKFIRVDELKKYSRENALIYLNQIIGEADGLEVDSVFQYLDKAEYVNSRSLKRYIFDLIALVNVFFTLKINPTQLTFKEEPINFADYLENKLVSSIEKLHILIKSNLLCEDYYTWMVAFLNKLTEQPVTKEMKIYEYENLIDKEIIKKFSPYALVRDYKKAYLNLAQQKNIDLNSLFDQKEFPKDPINSNQVLKMIEEADVPTTSIGYLFRSIQHPEESNFKRLLELDPNRNSYPFINLYLKYSEKIKILTCFFPIIDFTNALLLEFSFQISRKETKAKTLKQITTSDINLQKKFEAFKEAWETLCKNLPFSINRVDSLSEDHTLNYFLIDSNPDDFGIFLAEALKYLGKIHNEILSCFAKNESKTNYFRIQKLKESDMLKFENGMSLFLEKSWMINPEYSMGDELLYNFEGIEKLLKKSLNKGKLLDLDKIECVQYIGEILNFHSKDSGIVNEVRQKIVQEELTIEAKQLMLKFLEQKDLKDIYNSMTKVLFFTKEGAWVENTTINIVCETIKFKLNPIFRGKNILTSLQLKYIVHISELMEINGFNILKDSIKKDFKEEVNKEETKEYIYRCLKICKENPLKYPSVEDIRLAMLRFMIRYLTLEIDKELLIHDYIGNTGFWKKSENKITEFLTEFPAIFKLSRSIEVFAAIEDFISGKDIAKPAKPAKDKNAKPKDGKGKKGNEKPKAKGKGKGKGKNKDESIL